MHSSATNGPLRALAGISMGGFGAIHLGLTPACEGRFALLGSLCGVLDLQQLARDVTSFLTTGRTVFVADPPPGFRPAWKLEQDMVESLELVLGEVPRSDAAWVGTAWQQQDPRTMLKALPPGFWERQALYLDCGTCDEFGFTPGVEGFVQDLLSAGVAIDCRDSFAEPWLQPSFASRKVYQRFAGNHGGINERPLKANLNLFKRIAALLAFVDSAIVQDDESVTYGSAPERFVLHRRSSPLLGAERCFGVLLPPGYDEQNERRFPVLYFMLGYDMYLESFIKRLVFVNLVRIMLRKAKRRAFGVVLLSSRGLEQGNKGGWYLNAANSQAGRYQDEITQDLIPFIESTYRLGGGDWS